MKVVNSYRSIFPTNSSYCNCLVTFHRYTGSIEIEYVQRPEMAKWNDKNCVGLCNVYVHVYTVLCYTCIKLQDCTSLTLSLASWSVLLLLLFTTFRWWWCWRCGRFTSVFVMSIYCFWWRISKHIANIRNLIINNARVKTGKENYQQSTLPIAAPDWSINTLVFCAFLQSIILDNNRTNKTAVYSMMPFFPAIEKLRGNGMTKAM